MDISEAKAKYGIVSTDLRLDRAIDQALQVAPIRLSVLILGESGSGKEVFSQIIHNNSTRKHETYIAVNCGGIPEGTIDSELFGHEKGAFTGAISDHKGYFEMADRGTIFLDEVGDLPLSTQAKLLRVLEKGEYMKVGSTQTRKTDVRIIAATNVDLEKAIKNGRFREDLYYRLSGITLRIPPLRERRQDVAQLFHKFTHDFADKNHLPPVRLTDEALKLLTDYDWPGNVRQLKNIAEQITVLSKDRNVTADAIREVLPHRTTDLAVVGEEGPHSYSNEREILFKVLFDMRNDMNDLKKLVMQLLQGNNTISAEDEAVLKRLYQNDTPAPFQAPATIVTEASPEVLHQRMPGHEEHIEEAHYDDGKPEKTLSLVDSEKELIRKALEEFNGNKRRAAKQLGISERTLYRKIQDYNL